MTMIGGLLMFVSALLFYVTMVMTVTAGKAEPDQEIPWAERSSAPKDVPAALDRFTPWA